MTLTLTIRVPLRRAAAAPPATPAGLSGDGAGQVTGMLRVLLTLAEPAAMLAAEAAGLGLAGRIACAAALRSAERALAA